MTKKKFHRTKGVVIFSGTVHWKAVWRNPDNLYPSNTINWFLEMFWSASKTANVRVLPGIINISLKYFLSLWASLGWLHPVSWKVYLISLICTARLIVTKTHWVYFSWSYIGQSWALGVLLFPLLCLSWHFSVLLSMQEIVWTFPSPFYESLLKLCCCFRRHNLYVGVPTI